MKSLTLARLGVAVVLVASAAVAGGAVSAAAGVQASAQPTEAPQEEKLVYVKLATSMGDIVLELDAGKAPVSVENFLNYVRKGHYDGTIFHRVIPDFMIQGGGFTADMKQKPADKPIRNEWRNGLKNLRGTIAMARLGNQADSATCQFFINVKDNAFLDQPRDGAGYAVFGRVAAGMGVVDKIRGVKTGSKGGHQDVPLEPVTITKAEEMTADAAKSAIEAESPTKK